jgi:hypothetical protein
MRNTTDGWVAELNGTWAEFAHLPNQRFTDFSEVRNEIARVCVAFHCSVTTSDCKCIAACV